MLQAIANKNVPWKVKALSPFRFAKALIRAVYYKLLRKPLLADDNKELERKRICDECFNNDKNTCLICGCNIQLKTMIANEICPIGKWS